MEKFEALIALLEEARPDFVKFFDKGNAAAGTRARKALQELKQLSQELRIEIQEAKNNG
jgi:hypothetical protein